MAREPGSERGLRWWLRYIVVPIIVALIGGGGIAGIVVQVTSNNTPGPAATPIPTLVLPAALPTLTPAKVSAEPKPRGVKPSDQVMPETQEPMATPTIETVTASSETQAEDSRTEQKDLVPTPTVVSALRTATPDPLFAIEIGDIVADGVPEPGAR